MRSASLDRRQAKKKEPQPRLAPQVYSLAVPQASSHDAELLRLHARLKTVVGKIMDFVTLTSDLLTSQRLPESSLTAQRRLLDELEQEKGKWEQYMFYTLSVQENILENSVHAGLSTSGALGRDSSDFKRISDLIAEAQNKVTVVLRRRRDDASLGSKVWEVFTALNQRVYETFFRGAASQRTDDVRHLEDELERVRAKNRDLELQLVEASGQLKSRDLELQSSQRESRSSTQMRGDLQRAQDQILTLEAEIERLRAEPDTPSSLQRYAQSSSFKALKRELDRKSTNIDKYLTQSRPLAMSELEVSKLRNDFELLQQEVQQLREWKRRKLMETSWEEPRSDPAEMTQSRRLAARRQARPEEDEIRVQLSREQEKSTSFFNQLQRKEKECSDQQKASALLRTEVQHLRSLADEYDSKLRRQQDEVAKFLTLIKNLEEDKEQAQAQMHQHYQDKLKAEREAAGLKIQFANAADSEELMKQLRLAIEEKQKLAKALNEARTEATKSVEVVGDFQREKDDAVRALEHAVKENAALQERLKAAEKAAAANRESRQRNSQDRKAIQDFVSAQTQELHQQYSELSEQVDACQQRIGELQDALQNALEQVRPMKQRLAQEEARYHSAQKELSQLSVHHEADIADLSSEVRNLQSELSRGNTEREALSRQLRTKEAECNSLKRQCESLSQTLDPLRDIQSRSARLEEESLQLREALVSEKQARAALESELKSAKSALAQTAAADERTKSQASDWEAKARAAEKKAASYRERQASLESQVEQVTSALEQLEALRDDADRELAALREQNGALGRDLESARKDAREARRECEELRQTLTSSSADTDKKERLLRDLKASEDQWRQQVAALTAQLRESKSREGQALAELESERGENESLKAELSQRDDELSHNRDQLSALNMKVQEFKRIGAEADKRKQELEKRKAEAEERWQTAEKAQAALKRQLETAETALREAERRGNEQSLEAAELQDMVTNLQTRLRTEEANTEAARRQAKTEAAEHSSQLAACRQAEEQKTQELEALEARLLAAEAAQKRLLHEKSEMQRELAALQSAASDSHSKLSSEASTLSSQLATALAESSGLRATVAAKDEEIAQLTDDLTAARSEVDQLTEANARLAAQHKVQMATAEKRKLKAGNLKQTLQDSSQQHKDLQTANQRLNAELQSARDELKALQDRATAADTKAREVEPLKAQLVQAEQRASDLRLQASELPQVQQRLAAAESANSTLRQQAQSLEGMLADARAALAQANGRLEEMESMRKAASEVPQLQQRLQAAQSTADDLRAQVESLHKESQAVAGKLAGSQAVAGDLQRQLAQARAQLAEMEALRGQLATAQEGLEELQAQLETSQEEGETAMRQLETVYNALGGVPEDEDAFVSAVSALAETAQIATELCEHFELQSLSEIGESLAGLQSAAEEHSAALSARAREIASLQSSLEASQQDKTRCEKETARLQRALSESTQAAAALQEQLRAVADSKDESEGQQRARVMELQGRVAALERENSQLAAHLEAAGDEKRGCEQRVAAEERKAETLQRELKAANDRASRLEKEALVTSGELQSAAEALRTEQQRARKHSEEMARKVEEKEGRIDVLSSELAEARETAAKKDQQLKASDAHLADCKRQLADATQHSARQDQEASELTQRVHAAEGKVRKGELEAIQIREELKEATSLREEAEAQLQRYRTAAEEHRAALESRVSALEAQLRGTAQDGRSQLAAVRSSLVALSAGFETAVDQTSQNVSDRLKAKKTQLEKVYASFDKVVNEISAFREGEESMKQEHIATIESFGDFIKKGMRDVDSKVERLKERTEQTAAKLQTTVKSAKLREAQALEALRSQAGSDLRSSLHSLVAVAQARCEQDLSSLAARLRAAEDRCSHLALTQSQLTEKSKRDSAQVAALQDELARLRTAAEAGELRLEHTTAELAVAQRQLQEADGERRKWKEQAAQCEELSAAVGQERRKAEALQVQVVAVSHYLSTDISESFESSANTFTGDVDKRLETLERRIKSASSTVSKLRKAADESDLKLVDKEREILRLNNLLEAQDSQLQEENQRLSDLLESAHRRVAELEASQALLQKASKTSRLPNVFDLTELFNRASADLESTLSALHAKVQRQGAHLSAVSAKVARLRPVCVAQRRQIRESVAACEATLLRQLMEIDLRLDAVSQGRANTAAEVYEQAMEMAGQIEEMVMVRLEETEARLERLAQTTEQVINHQAEEIEMLQHAQRGNDSPEPLDRAVNRKSSLQTIEDVLSAADQFIVCKRTRFLDDVWCLVMVGDDRELYWWREDDLQQFDPRSEDWPEVEEDTLHLQINELTQRAATLDRDLKDRTAETQALQAQVQSLRESMQREGVDLERVSMGSALQELLSLRAQSARAQQQSHSPIDPATLESADVTVMTEDSGRHPASMPPQTSEEEFAPFVESVVNVLFDLMVLPKDQVAEIQLRRSGGVPKEEKKKEKTGLFHRKRKPT